jgi:prepilin peptidase CpaA
MIAIGLMLVLIAIASVTDARDGKIYNWTVYPGIAAALTVNILAALLPQELVAQWQPIVGWIGWWESVKGCAACGLVMIVCFVFFGLGGGDVKLMTMMGAFLGLDRGLEALLWTFILGACLGLSVLVWRVGAIRLVDRALRHLVAVLRWGTPAGLSDEEKKELKTQLFLAPCSLAAALIVQFHWLDIS